MVRAAADCGDRLISHSVKRRRSAISIMSRRASSLNGPVAISTSKTKSCSDGEVALACRMRTRSLVNSGASRKEANPTPRVGARG